MAGWTNIQTIEKEASATSITLSNLNKLGRYAFQKHSTTTLTWDGNLEGKEYYEIVKNGLWIVKVSSTFPEDFQTRFMGKKFIFNGKEYSISEITYEDVNIYTAVEPTTGAGVLVALNDEAAYQSIPISKGLYFPKSHSSYVSSFTY